jgi:hypothetical protein
LSPSFRVWLDREILDATRLCLEFQCRGYAGRGGAFLDVSKLEQNAQDFLRYPLLAENPASLSMGYLDKSDHTKVSDEHIGVSAFPLGPSGRLILRVRVAEPFDEPSRSGFQRVAIAEFGATYEQLKQFSLALISLVRGDIREVNFGELPH